MNNNTRQVLITGVVSSLAVAATAAVCGKVEGQSPWRPINAISHIVWDKRAAKRNRFTLQYTGMGLLLNVVACGFWAWLYRRWGRSIEAPGPFSASVGRGIAISVLAYVTDYYIVPRRFTPGFELILSRGSFPWIYGALAAGLFIPEFMKPLFPHDRLDRRRLNGSAGGRDRYQGKT